MNVCIVGAAGR